MENNILINPLLLKKMIDSLSNIIQNVSIKFYTSTSEWIMDSQSYNTDFCSMMHKYSRLNVECNICDHKGLELARTSSKPVIYKCHMGLMELTYPLFYNDIFLGVIFMGQFLNHPVDEFDNHNLKKLAEKWNLDTELTIKYFNRLVVFDNKQITDIQNVLNACAYYIVNNESYLTEGESTIQKIEQYIDNHLKEDITLEQIAKNVNLNPSYLSSLYSKRKHISLFKYIQKRRIEMACYYLRCTKKTAAEIATEIGISDQNYFTRIFKDLVHVTPSFYRKNWEQIDKGRDLKDFHILK